MIQERITTLKERLTCFIARKKTLLNLPRRVFERMPKPEDTDYSLVLLHEKVDALAEAAGYTFYKPRMKDHLGNDVLDVFKARKRAKR